MPREDYLPEHKSPFPTQAPERRKHYMVSVYDSRGNLITTVHQYTDPGDATVRVDVL